ncbi:amidohydrolase [uncultured Desulfosarcina sp.]|uniref:M20 metallopeptidase family protein n=1 Tax=uncultured Desulfosarcina sp. TaxID=218289 RepID=UPI0029C8700C|nr:amidohydrolase [uncultured Desulfosarcina sp.]
MQIFDPIEPYRDELIALRRDFHQHPELGFEEHRTAEVVEAYLKDLGLPTRRMAGTGVVALLDGSHPGPVLMLRADMDALPVAEENDVDYRSRNPGVMHACGHDAHMAMLLVAAKVLSHNRDAITGTIKFVFQPNEEVAGALRMIEEGVLENPAVDAVMGLHVWTPVASGRIGITAGPVMGGLDVFKMTIFGKGGHTGIPEDAIDPVIAAANLIQTVQMIQTREISNLKSTVIMFGKISGGTKSNVIPDKIDLEGSIRFLYKGGPDSIEQPTERFRRVAEQVCRTHRCTCRIDIVHENIPLINDPGMAALARRTAEEVFEDKNAIIDNLTIASEDFSEFSERVPGVFMFLGAGNEKKGTTVSHHHPRFNIDEDVLLNGVAMHVHGALNFLTLPANGKGGDRQTLTRP